MKLEIQEKYQEEVIGFNNSGLPLGKRTQEDLIDLAIKAQRSNPGLKRFFKKLPTLKELLDAKAGKFIDEPAPTQEPAITAIEEEEEKEEKKSGRRSKNNEK